jgi:hypothetical protein
MRFLAGAIALLLSACAQSPTVIDTEVTSDGTVPPIMLIQMTVRNDSQPALQSSSQEVSLNPGLEAGVPGPFIFPLVLPISVDSTLAGAVTVTVQGLDWTSSAVIATGSTTAQVVAGKTTQALVMLTSTTTCTSSDVTDASLSCDGGADGTGD